MAQRSFFYHRYPIVSFFLLAMVIGTGLVLMVAKGWIPESLALTSVLSASVSGVIMTALLQGKDGLKVLFRRLLAWRVGTGYWLFALLFLIPTFFLGSLFNPLFGGDPLPFSGLGLGFNLLLMFSVFFLVVGVGQEIGWTGFLLPRLQARYSALSSCLIRTVFVAIWHLPFLIYLRDHPYALPDFPYGIWIRQKGFLFAFTTMIVLMLLWSIFYTWMFNNTGGSLLLVAVLHGSEIWLAYWMMRTGISPSNLDNYWGYLIIMALLAGVIVAVTGSQNLSRSHQRVVYPE